MDKKDIYEHLAKIYLDASQKRKKRIKEFSKLSKNIFFISIAFILGFSIFFISRQNKKPALDSQMALVLCPDAVKINFHFNPAKKEIYSIDLKKMDLSRFKSLEFSAKTAHYQDNAYLRVEFNSALKEKSEVYLKDVSHKWQDYKIPFLDFKDISDWSNIANLSFIVDEWNVGEKKGMIYIDNVRLLK